MWTRYNHSMEDMYTLEGLKRAQEDLKRWEEKWANSDSNNPNKFRGNINEARSRVRLIESVLKIAPGRNNARDVSVDDGGDRVGC